MRLLLVDDEAGFRALLRTTCEVFDIDVEEADSVAAAERLIRRDPPDVIVLDVMMPGTDGLTFCRRLKADPATAEIPVVLLSGSDGGEKAAADAAGGDAFVGKPFSPPVERKQVEQHTLHGEQMVRGVAVLREEGLKVVRSHHERWDGAGYPDALRGDEIPLGARIFSVADTLEAITDNRVYRRPRSWDRAAREIDRVSGSQFDPDVVAAFHDCEDELLEIRRTFARAPAVVN